MFKMSVLFYKVVFKINNKISTNLEAQRHKFYNLKALLFQVFVEFGALFLRIIIQ